MSKVWFRETAQLGRRCAGTRNVVHSLPVPECTQVLGISSRVEDSRERRRSYVPGRNAQQNANPGNNFPTIIMRSGSFRTFPNMLEHRSQPWNGATEVANKFVPSFVNRNPAENRVVVGLWVSLKHEYVFRSCILSRKHASGKATYPNTSMDSGNPAQPWFVSKSKVDKQPRWRDDEYEAPKVLRPTIHGRLWMQIPIVMARSL